jgi:hypothetical protein
VFTDNILNTSATTLTIVDSDSAAVTFGTMANAGGAVGTAAMTSLVASNSGAATLVIGNVAATPITAALTSATLTGAVQLGVTGAAPVVFTDSATAAITISGGSDNANSNINFSAATAALTTTAVTLGNGNNTIAFGAVTNTANTVHSVTVGNGNNTIIDSAATNAVKDVVSVGSGTNVVTFQALATHVASLLTFTAPNAASTTTLTSVANMVGAVGGIQDQIAFAVAPITTTVSNLSATYASVAAGLAAAQTLTASGVVTFQVTGAILSGNNATYIYENTGSAATSELVLVGQFLGNVQHTGTLVGSLLTLTA